MLWNESSRTPTWQAIIGLLFQWLFPFLPIILIPKPIRDSDVFRGLAWFFFVTSFIALLWHVYVLFVLIQNRKDWKRAWFTFRVPSGTIGLVDSGESHELTLFHFSANIRFIKTTYSTITRLHTISQHEQEILEDNMQRRNLDACEVILYTEDFLNCYSSWPKYMTLGLILCQFASFVLVMVLLTLG